MANLDIIIKATDQASGTIKTISGNVERFGEAGSRGLSKVTSMLGTGLKVAAGVGLGAIVGLGAGFTKAAFDGFGLNSTLEDTRAQLVAFTKDGKIADQMLADIRAEAARTPFAFQELASATASLLPASKQSGVALEELIKQAEILAASNPAQGLEGAAFSLREALSGDFVSIIDRFNLPRQRLNELKAEGVPAMEAISIAMREMGLDAGLVTGMAETMTGRWSTFKDTMDTLKASLAQPIFDLVKDGLKSIQPLLDENMPKLQEFATMIGTKAAEAVSGFVEGGIEKVGELRVAWADDWGGIRTTVENTRQEIGREFREIGVSTDAFMDAFNKTFRSGTDDTQLTWETFWGEMFAGASDAIVEIMDAIDKGLKLGTDLMNIWQGGIFSSWDGFWDSMIRSVMAFGDFLGNFFTFEMPGWMQSAIDMMDLLSGFGGNQVAVPVGYNSSGTSRMTPATTSATSPSVYNISITGTSNATDTAYAVQDAIQRTQRLRGY